MTIGIYLIENKITKKQYIGQSIHIEKRIKQHQHKRDLNNSYLENSIKKYGWENFTWTILHKCSKEELNNEEIKFIALDRRGARVLVTCVPKRIIIGRMVSPLILESTLLESPLE